MDPVGRASFEYFSATGHLPDNLSTSRKYCEMLKIADVSTHSRRSPYWVRFLALSQTRKHLVVADKTYWYLPGRCQQLLGRLERDIQYTFDYKQTAFAHC